MYRISAIALAIFIALPALSGGAYAADNKSVIETYADIAHAGYEDSLYLAKTLRDTLERLTNTPSKKTMAAAREAWIASRVPYMQTEVFRFGNPIVDDWEGKVNAWPLDEGLIDYVADSYGKASNENPVYTANVVANEKIRYGGKEIDASTIDKTLLAETLHELGGIEANVATGYHAIEFLLWGQDLNGTNPGSGNRPWTDYAKGDACTHGHCQRRAAYLMAAADLLIDDLAWITGQWAAGGDARQALMEGDGQKGITAILTGLGSLSYGELAGERMKLGLMLHDPEEEHDCFSDNTHNSHYYDVVGMLNIYHGRYHRVDGSTVEGPSLSDLVRKKAPMAEKSLADKLAATEKAMRVLKQRAEKTEAYDQMIGADNPQGNAVVQNVIDALTAQTRAIEDVIAALDIPTIEIEGSDSLDNPEAVFE